MTDRRESSPLRELAWPLLLLLGLAFALYANTFGHAWTHDDFPVIVDNPDILSWRNFFADSYPGRPLRELTYLLDHALFGLNPAGWHIQNILWHGLNAWLLFVLATRLSAGRFVAWAAALLFLVHPLTVEVVANISHRKDSLALAFSLLAVLAYIQAGAAARRRTLWLVAALLAWGGALLAKENAVMLPLVLLAYDYALVEPSRRLLLKKMRPWLVSGALAVGAGLCWYGLFGGMARHFAAMRMLAQGKGNYFGEVSPDLYYRMMLKSWSFMFGKVVWPVDLALEYTYAMPKGWLDPWVVAALLGLVGCCVGLWLAARRAPVGFFALVWIGAFWLPVSNLWPLAYFAADRYLYAPLAGIGLLLGLAARRLFKSPVPRWGFVIGCILLWAVLSWRQNRIWKDPETLWSHAQRVSPDSAFALNNMGNVHLLKGELLLARDWYARALAANPMNSTASYNLGLIYERIGLRDMALDHYRRFLAIGEPTFRVQAEALRTRLNRQYGENF